VLTTAWDNLNRFSGFLSVKEETAKAVVVADSGHAPRLSEVLMKWDMAAQGTAQTTRITRGAGGGDENLSG
jgi:hypothetical protein